MTLGFTTHTTLDGTFVRPNTLTELGQFQGVQRGINALAAKQGKRTRVSVDGVIGPATARGFREVGGDSVSPLKLATRALAIVDALSQEVGAPVSVRPDLSRAPRAVRRRLKKSAGGGDRSPSSSPLAKGALVAGAILGGVFVISRVTGR